MLDHTHDASLASWVESANDPTTDFPLQNLPFGVFVRRMARGGARVGVAIGDCILDVLACRNADLLSDDAAAAADACAEPRLNGLMALGRDAARVLRRELSALLDAEGPASGRARRAAADILAPMAECELLLPASIGDYTDFYASIHHATNVGSMFRPDHPLLPNYKWVPIGYHGRASSIVPSGSPIRRPWGQLRDDPNAPPAYAPTRRLDYEVEVGAFIGGENPTGTPISIDAAESRLFGLCLVNDWSARDVQAWEYQPLGPFLAKSFATTISPWVVTLDALEPFRAPAFIRPPGDPAPLPHLISTTATECGGIDIHLEVLLLTERMRAEGLTPFRMSAGSFTEMYWTVSQLVTHHASNGCNLRPGDLLASGTVSGSTPESRGSLLERAWRGTEPVALPTGETRAFVRDGDEVTLRASCERAGFRRIGFGSCVGRVLPALAAPV